MTEALGSERQGQVGEIAGRVFVLGPGGGAEVVSATMNDEGRGGAD